MISFITQFISYPEDCDDMHAYDNRKNHLFSYSFLLCRNADDCENPDGCDHTDDKVIM